MIICKNTEQTPNLQSEALQQKPRGKMMVQMVLKMFYCLVRKQIRAINRCSIVAWNHSFEIISTITERATPE